MFRIFKKLKNKYMNLEWSEIESIELLGEQETIDICVEDTHCFFANDIYTHNSGFKSELNDTDTIGRAIEVFQKADQVITYTQPPHLIELKQCYAYLLKNRAGQKEVLLLVYYDPAKVLFTEIEVLNKLVMLSDNQKKVVEKTVSKTREKLNLGGFDLKK